MGRAKLPRKSTAIDMTAMCDVAFLLLSFFILTTKFKPSEAIAVTTPNSVSAKKAPKKNFVMVTIDKDGKVFLSIDDRTKRVDVISYLNSTKNLGADETKFKNADYIGTSFSKLNSYLSIPQENRIGEQLPGIPCKDTLNNELTDWMRAVNSAYAGKKYDLLLKGDNISKYPSFKAVIAAFKKNDIQKFQIVTNPEGAPKGSELYKNPKTVEATKDENN
jgi:biopolymer transport protein ExbD